MLTTSTHTLASASNSAPVSPQALAASPASDASPAMCHAALESRDEAAMPLDDLAQVFKLLSDGTRLKILVDLLHSPELHVRALCDRLGQSQPAVSHHLALLRVAGLLECRREGKHNFYRLARQRWQGLVSSVFRQVEPEARRVGIEDLVMSYLPLRDRSGAR